MDEGQKVGHQLRGFFIVSRILSRENLVVPEAEQLDVKINRKKIRVIQYENMGKIIIYK